VGVIVTFEEGLLVVKVKDPVGTTEVTVLTPVGLGVSRGGMDMIPVIVDREGSVMTETTDSETGGTLVTLPVRPIKVSITAL
jgi:hypothetical protein